MDEMLRPSVTKVYAVCCLITSCLINLNLISPYSVCYAYKLAISNFQPWRLITSFLYLGMLDYAFIVKLCVGLYALATLEAMHSQNKTYSRFIWMGLVLYGILLLVSSIYPMYFLTNAYFMSILTIRCMLIEKQRIPVTETFSIKAQWIPFGYALISILFGSSFSSYFIGGGIGYLYSVIQTPQFIRTYGDYLNPPIFLKKYFGDKIQMPKQPQNTYRNDQSSKPKLNLTKQDSSFKGRGVIIG